ncbi:conserved hypothetical protein [Burkholderia mallei PRL-20]|uniref:Uncharacterized protein n=1 Tax=Burkholderia mallei (strain NCTC 10229) TaxID=412022 RepID=A2S7C8_BURM9|nr:hypothetical protein BMASAVP1_A3501 [Burkholderia mallei SAVP1]ABN03146.1 hypothetical protein BMA10229_A1872 [Burkholderia mallei NCTC 10229]ABN84568.1 hypothetical protein BURPS668_0025 [Burkholderia pseudomallei 668]ABO04230.1 hypothetical protein BMA10247_2680 [Burkholderia mallei NCTC 10247]EBA47382.1 hypothetical protein BURPS305_3063 [Burkholderia pseudomallei 305]EDK84518.1 hypothetical protein BMA721280_E0330 [Burkholderia mallei 2002721280]EDP86105.1 hypothetical protein BMA10399
MRATRPARAGAAVVGRVAVAAVAEILLIECSRNALLYRMEAV